MAKSKKHLSRRGKINNVQIIYSEPQKIFKEDYLSPKGKRLLKEDNLSREEIIEKYGKKRYTINHDAKPKKQIKHIKY